VTWRAVLLGLTGAIHVCILQVVSKVVPQNVVLPYGSALTLMSGAVFWLFLLALLNALLRWRRPGWALRPAEFAVIYGITTVAAGIGAQDEVMQLFPMFVFPFRATQEATMGAFRAGIPEWLAPRDPAVVEPYYLGGGSFWRPELLRAWAVPLFCWMLWLAALGATMWAWNAILRRRWVDQDRLAFPCLQLPMEMCREGGFGGMLSGRLFWGGFLVSALLESLAQINARYPDMPSIPLGFNATPLLQGATEPWNALAPMSLAWSNLHLGICYFIPLDILFSGWFFYLFRKGEEVFGYTMGWRELGWDASGFPFTRSQAAGAWIALFFLLVWAERRHLARVLTAALSFGNPPSPIQHDANEPASSRLAGRLLIGGTLFLIAWSVASGMSLWLALVFYAFFWMLNVTMTRIYAQVGPPILELYFLDPQKTLTTVFGTHGQSPQSLTIFSLMYWINRTDRGHPMAHQLSAFKIGQVAGVNLRALGFWVYVAFLVGCLVCILTGLHWAYRVGEDQYVQGGWQEAFAPLAVSRINEWVKTPKGPQWTEIAYMVVGGATTLALAKASYTFIGFPLHPIGFALAMCFTMEYNWPAYLGIWAVKGLILRYGGRTLYLRLTPFFLGLILGGFVVPILWGFVAWLFGWYA
jgi:hypothetical protein